MEANEILNNEEVMETTAEEVTKMSSGKSLKVVAGIGFVVLTGIIAYKYVGKPLIAKIKTKKEQKEAIDVVDVDTVISEERNS